MHIITTAEILSEAGVRDLAILDEAQVEALVVGLKFVALGEELEETKPGGRRGRAARQLLDLFETLGIGEMFGSMAFLLTEEDLESVHESHSELLSQPS